jgi:hypothetical protein
MKSVETTPVIKDIKVEQIRELIFSSFKIDDKIHISKKRRLPIVNSPAIFKGAYNHFVMIQTHVNESYWETFTISYSELFTGDTIIHELSDLLQIEE